jgi:peptide/nickel transport system substrate-binding protein
VIKHLGFDTRVLKKGLLWGLCSLLVACQSTKTVQPSAFRCSGSWFIPPSFHGNPWSQGGDGTHLAFVYEPLFLYLPDSQTYLPQLGLSYQSSGQRLSIQLRPEARWHDGTPFTAQDVKSSFLLYWLQGWGGRLKSIETPDAHTIHFEWHEPVGPLEMRQVLGRRIQAPAHLFGQWSGPAEKLLQAMQQKLGATRHYSPSQQTFYEDLLLKKSDLLQAAYALRPDKVIGTNAYRVSKVTSSELVLDRYPASWHTQARVEQVRILRGSTNDVMWAYLLGGDIDASHATTPPDVAHQIQRLNPRVKLFHLPDFADFGFVFNFRKPPLQDQAFRQALARMLDRDRLRMVGSYYSLTSDDQQLPLMQSDAARWVSPDLKADLLSYAYDPEAASKQLVTAGYQRNPKGQWLTPDGQPISLEIAVIAGYSDWVLASEAVAAELTHLGIPTQVRTYDAALYHQLLRQGSFDMAAAFGFEYRQLMHPGVSLDRLFSQGGYLGLAAGLPSRMKGPNGKAVTLQQQVETVVGSADPQAVKKSAETLLWLANHELPFLSIYEKRISVFALEGERVKGWPAPNDPIWSLSSTSIDTVYAYLLSSGQLQPGEHL